MDVWFKSSLLRYDVIFDSQPERLFCKSLPEIGQSMRLGNTAYLWTRGEQLSLPSQRWLSVGKQKLASQVHLAAATSERRSLRKWTPDMSTDPWNATPLTSFQDMLLAQSTLQCSTKGEAAQAAFMFKF